MRLHSVEAIAVDIPLTRNFGGSTYAVLKRSTVVTRLRTDEGPVSEVYNGDNREHGPEIVRLIHEELAPRLRGQDLFDGERIWERLFALSHSSRDRKTLMEAIACVDCAIWDLVGKARGQSVCALLGGRPEAEVLAFRQFGHYIGLVFQVVDDILDITADEAKLGKAVGTDLRQGLATLPILYALNDGINPAPIVAVLEAKTDREEDVLEALELVRRSSAVDQAYTYAEQVNRQARECLTGIHSRYRDTLEALTENLLVRES